MTFHTGQQASKQMQCKPRGTPSRELKRSPLSRNMGRPLTSIVLNLTLPKLHLATLNSPKYLYKKYMEDSEENMHVDLRV